MIRLVIFKHLWIINVERYKSIPSNARYIENVEKMKLSSDSHWQLTEYYIFTKTG